MAPASSLEGGLAALSAGADAIYVGAPKFGARSAAGVSIEDIRQLCEAAHIYNAAVYVALNTILDDEELAQAVELTHQLYSVGADALIIQDMGLLMQELPPIPLHASTQCHNDSLEKIELLQECGIQQVVLPREMSTADMARISEQTTMHLEAFIHGALCVSYSGRCFISQACRGRSANRGACAQYCRMSYDLEDADGNKLREGEHLLSLRDLNRSEILEQLLESGVTSLKIEGRLKGLDYVKNVTAHYRQQLDHIIKKHPDKYRRTSWGREQTNFTPQVEATFSRRFTTYNTPIGQPIPVESITPFTNKSVGQLVGHLIKNSGKELLLQLNDTVELVNGDGLLFVSTDQKTTAGAYVNQVVPKGKERYQVKLSQSIQNINNGAKVYRNLNHQLDLQLQRPDATVRKLPISIECIATTNKVTITVAPYDYPHIHKTIERAIVLEQAQKDNTEHLRRTLSKLGETPYTAEEIRLELNGLYLPPSVATDMRREAVDQLDKELNRIKSQEIKRIGSIGLEQRKSFLSETHDRRRYGIPDQLDFTYNVANRSAEAFYRRVGVTGTIEKALEVAPKEGSIPVMFCRHCLLHQVGYCTKEGKQPPFKLPLYLVRGQERFRLTTDCRQCRMIVRKDN